MSPLSRGLSSINTTPAARYICIIANPAFPMQFSYKERVKKFSRFPPGGANPNSPTCQILKYNRVAMGQAT
jgi:hypothetical protein